MAYLNEMPNDREPKVTLDANEDFQGHMHPEDVLFWIWQNNLLASNQKARLLYDQIQESGTLQGLATYLEKLGHDLYQGTHGIYIYKA